MSVWQDRPLRAKRRLIGDRPGTDGDDGPYGRQRGFRRYKVSSVGQMTLPASARRRWGLDGAGVVEVADLGSAVLILPAEGSDVLLDAWLESDELRAEAERLLTAPHHGRQSSSPGVEYRR